MLTELEPELAADVRTHLVEVGHCMKGVLRKELVPARSLVEEG